MLTLCSRFRSFSLPFRFLSSSSLPVLATQLSAFSFLLSSPLCLTATLRVLPFRISTSWPFPLPLHLVSHALLSFLNTQLSVRFLSSLSVSLPQPFHRCSLCFRFRAFPSRSLSFVRSRLVLTTQPSVLSFPFFPFFPVGGSSGAAPLSCDFLALPLPSSLLPCLPSDSSTQLTAIPFSVHCFASQLLPQCLNLAVFFPFACALGFGYSACPHLRFLRREL